MQLDYAKTVEKIRGRLREYIVMNHLGSLVGGISGGVDSALTFALAYPVCRELGISLIGRSLTIESNKPDEIARAKAIGEAFCTDFAEEDLTPNFVAMYDGSVMDSGDKIDRGNAKARLRMIRLYGLARQNHGLVLSTDNLTEYYMGFFTINGDVGDLGMIQNFSKPEVYAMASYLSENVEKGGKALEDCIKSNPTDGLGIADSDLDQLMPDWRKRHDNYISAYAEVHERIEKWIEREPTLPDVIITHDPVISRYRNTHFKRKIPVNFSRQDVACFKR